MLSCVSFVFVLFGGITASISDMKRGIVPNRLVLALAAVGFALNLLSIAGGRMGAASYVGNVMLVALVALVLFYTHVWAGGDCKLSIALALAYPRGWYLEFSDVDLTLCATFAFAFSAGYIWLALDGLQRIAKGVDRLSWNDVLQKAVGFGRSYIYVLAAVTMVRLLFFSFCPDMDTMALPLWFLGFLVAHCLRTISALRRPVILVGLLAFDALGIWLFDAWSLLGSPLYYVGVAGIALLQAVLSQNRYDCISAAEVKKGMILSTASSLMLLASINDATFYISNEGLESRLSEEDAAEIRSWSSGRGDGATVSIVRKVPFALFVFSGFMAYALLWWGLR